LFKQFDIGIAKRVSTWSRATAEFRVDVLNAFNHVNFVPRERQGERGDDDE